MPEFFDLLILMVVIWTTGKIFRMLKLPVVFGMLVGGILVGPSLLGLVDPDTEMIKILAQLGVFFLMLHAGLENNYKELLATSKKSVLIAFGGTIIPFIGGYFVSIWFGQPQMTSLFIGMGLSISAIALAARLFKDNKILHFRAANITMGAAVIENIFALILFTVIIKLAQQGEVQPTSILILLAKVTAFFVIVLYGGSKLAKFLNRIIYFGNKGFTLTLIIALLLGLIAEAIGLHMIIGAFLAGLFIQQDILEERVFNKIEDRIYGLSYGFFGPIFFASLAFHLDFTAFKTAPFFLLAIITMAILGKFIGCGLTGKLIKLKNIESLIIGSAMNSRGASVLVITTLGFQLKIIDQTTFSILILMAFITTVISIFTTTYFANKLKEAQS